MSISKVFLCGLLVLVYSAVQARAALVTPVAVAPSSEFAPAINLINGSGLDGIGPVTGQLHDNDENNMWQAWGAFGGGASVGESVVFELDGLYDLSSAYVWQYNGPVLLDPNDPSSGFHVPQREIKDFDISISPDLVSPFVSLGTKTLLPALDVLSGPIPDFNEPVQTLGLAGSNLARRVKFTTLSIFSDPNNLDDGFAGLSEVRFEGISIPEPVTLGLAALSALSLPWLMRRRSRNRS